MDVVWWIRLMFVVHAHCVLACLSISDYLQMSSESVHLFLACAIPLPSFLFCVISLCHIDVVIWSICVLIIAHMPWLVLLVVHLTDQRFDVDVMNSVVRLFYICIVELQLRE
jgi:hypothetical protein